MSPKASYLAVFDVDGTICDTQGSDGLCFGLAVERVLGRPFAAQEWTTYEEPTGGAILRELLAGDPDAAEKETAQLLVGATNLSFQSASQQYSCLNSRMSRCVRSRSRWCEFVPRSSELHRT
jgi:hypothetical protein